MFSLLNNKQLLYYHVQSKMWIHINDTKMLHFPTEAAIKQAVML